MTTPQAKYPSTLVPNGANLALPLSSAFLMTNLGPEPLHPTFSFHSAQVSARNILSLLPALSPYLSLPTTTRVLELASGQGTHLQAYSDQFPDVTFVPSECDEFGLEEIKKGLEEKRKEGEEKKGKGKGKVEEAIKVDVMEDEDWKKLEEKTKDEKDKFDLVIGANFLHMIPFPSGAQKIFSHLSSLTSTSHNNVHFCIYGPFRSISGFFSESDKAFDENLKSRPNGDYLGLRPVEELEEIARDAGIAGSEGSSWRLKERIEMPKGNLVLVFHKVGGEDR